MSSSSDIEKRLTSVLHDAAKVLNLSNYAINLNFNAIRGDGFLGEFYKVSITNKDTKEEIHLAVKKAPEVNSAEAEITLCYKNEIRFYSVVYPAFQKFEKEHQVSAPFESVPPYITSVDDLGKEIIVLKDITYEGFQLREKKLLLDDEHASMIFKKYGHFHAISFCLKDQKPEECKKLTQPFLSFWKPTQEKDSFRTYYSDLISQCYEALDGDDCKLIREKFKKYRDNPMETFNESLNYYGNYSGFLHGDCWSNNMMFKYQNHADKKNLENMILLDFQLAIVGTPVFDLSYFFYTGGNKELFDDLERYLDIYYESFSSSARNLGGNPEKLLPREALSQDWKKYSKLGMLLALMLTRIKLVSKEDTIEMMDQLNEGDNAGYKMKFSHDIFKIRVQDIVRHMYEIDAM